MEKENAVMGRKCFSVVVGVVFEHLWVFFGVRMGVFWCTYGRFLVCVGAYSNTPLHTHQKCVHALNCWNQNE